MRAPAAGRAPAPRRPSCAASSTSRERARRAAGPRSPRSPSRFFSSMAGEHGFVGDQRGMRRIEQMTGHRVGRRGEGVERIDALGDLGDAAMAVLQHAGDPARIGEPAAHDAGDLLGQPARLGRFGLAGVEMVELGRRCPAAPPRRRSRRRSRRRRRRRARRARGRPADAPARRRSRRGRGSRRRRRCTARRRHRHASTAAR